MLHRLSGYLNDQGLQILFLLVLGTGFLMLGAMMLAELTAPPLTQAEVDGMIRASRGETAGES